jgi:hypothetical protein
MRHDAKTSLALALTLALQLPITTVWAEESKAVEPAKTVEPAKAEPSNEAAKAAQEAVSEAEKQNKLMEKFQVMLEEGEKAENPTLKAAADKMIKILDNPTPPSISELDAAFSEFKTAKGTLSPEDGTTIDEVGNLLRDILKKIAEKPIHQEKAPAAPSENPAKASDSDEEKAPAEDKVEKK